MIKVTVSGAESRLAGELIRILVNHPEVEILSVKASGHEGLPVTSIHSGLIGEVPVKVSSSNAIDPSTNILFLCNKISPADYASLRVAFPEMKIVSFYPFEPIVENSCDISLEESEQPDASKVIYALPEINRKPLVRGAMTAVIPNPIASATLVALFPLALHILLNQSLEISVSAPADIIDEHGPDAAAEIAYVLKQVQRSFDHEPQVQVATLENDRHMEINLRLDCHIDIQHLMEMYEIYDDHNFAFAVTQPITPAETANTDKCVFRIQKPNEETLEIQIVADPRMRGGAGEAVHVMNLLCGLHEKTGLSMKSSSF